MARGTTYGAVDSPAGTSTATKFAADGPAGQIVGGPSISDVTIHSIFCSVYSPYRRIYYLWRDRPNV